VHVDVSSVKEVFCCHMYVRALVLTMIVLEYIVVMSAWLASILNYKVLKC